MNRARPERLAALAAKYEALLRLRTDKANGTPLPPKQVFVALNAEFPGALVELDRLSIEELTLRAKNLRAAARGEELEVEWMTALDLYHSLMRAGLALRTARGSGDIDSHLRAVATRASEELGLAVTSEDLRPMVQRETRRLVPAVLELTARVVEWPRDRVAKLLGRDAVRHIVG